MSRRNYNLSYDLSSVVRNESDNDSCNRDRKDHSLLSLQRLSMALRCARLKSLVHSHGGIFSGGYISQISLRTRFSLRLSHKIVFARPWLGCQDKEPCVFPLQRQFTD